MPQKTRKRCNRSPYLAMPPKMIEIYGYKILLLPMPKKFVFVQSYVNAGFVSENKQNAGIAHLLEHVLTDSWKKCNKEPCEKYWDHQGIQMNASTSSSVLNYWIRGLEEYTSDMLEYIISITCSPSIHQTIIHREKQIVQNELLILQNKPISRLYDRCNKTLYISEGLRYSNDIPQQLKNVDTFTKKQLLHFRNTHYTPTNIIFTVAGGFRQKEIRRLFHTYLPKGCKQTPEIALLYPPRCFNHTQDIIYDKRADAKNTRIIFVFHTAFQPADQIYFPLLNDIIGGSMSSLLMKVLRLKYKLIYGLSFDIETLFCGSIISLEMSTKDSNIKKVMLLTIQTIKKYICQQITKKLLENIKNKHLLRIYRSCNSPAGLSSFYAIQYVNQIYAAHTTLYTPDKIKKAIQKVTTTMIQQLLSRLFHMHTCIIGYQGRQKIAISFSDFR